MKYLNKIINSDPPSLTGDGMKGISKLVMIILAAALIAAAIFFLPISPKRDDSGYSDDPTNHPEWKTAGNVTVIVMNVGQGDATLIHTPDGKTILIDAGPEGSGTVVSYYMHSLGMDVIDAMVITHPHADHLGGADEVLGEFQVLSIYHPGYQMTTQAYSDFLTASAAEGCPVHTDADVDPGDYINIGTAISLRVLAIDASAPDPNSASIVLLLTYGNDSFLFDGDAPSAVEDPLPSLWSISDVDYLKVAHHGSGYSTSDLFLDAIGVDVAFISVGENDYGHPSSDTLHRLETHGVQVCTTMEETWVIELDGNH
jgi:competence protein ComEC